MLYRPPSPPPTVPCKFCSKMFKTELSVQYHIRMSHKDSWIVCKKCSKKYKDMPTYLKHKCRVRTPRPRRKKGEIPVYACEPCNKTFAEQKHLKVHLTVSLCHKEVMKRLQSLDQTEPEYIAPENPPDPPGIFCPKCPEWFESDNHLIVHLVNHGLTYTCDVCSETVKEWSNIYQHLQTHLDPSYENPDITHEPTANISLPSPDLPQATTSCEDMTVVSDMSACHSLLTTSCEATSEGSRSPKTPPLANCAGPVKHKTGRTSLGVPYSTLTSTPYQTT